MLSKMKRDDEQDAWNNVLGIGGPFLGLPFAVPIALCGRRDKRRPICGCMFGYVGWNKMSAHGVPLDGHPFA